MEDHLTTQDVSFHLYMIMLPITNALKMKMDFGALRKSIRREFIFRVKGIGARVDGFVQN